FPDRPSAELGSKDPVPVTEQIFRRSVEGKGLPHLLRRPLCRRMGGHIEMDDPPAIVSQHQEHVQHLETNCWNGEEIDRHRGLDVILKEGLPGLRGRLALARHVLAHARFADVDAEFEQFPMDAGRTPKRMITTQLPNEFAHILWNGWSSSLLTANFPRPE